MCHGLNLFWMVSKLLYMDSIFKTQMESMLSKTTFICAKWIACKFETSSPLKNKCFPCISYGKLRLFVLVEMERSQLQWNLLVNSRLRFQKWDAALKALTDLSNFDPLSWTLATYLQEETSFNSIQESLFKYSLTALNTKQLKICANSLIH